MSDKDHGIMSPNKINQPWNIINESIIQQQQQQLTNDIQHNHKTNIIQTTNSSTPNLGSGVLKDWIVNVFEEYKFSGSSEHSKQLKSFVDFFCEKMLISIGKSENILQVDSFSCPVCYGVFMEPVTIECGHTYCRKCLGMERSGRNCRRCKYILSSKDVGKKQINVLINSIVEKWWPNYIEANNYRNEGNILFQDNKGYEALTKYTQAIEKCEDDHLSLGNRAQALLTLGRSEEALKDAELAIKSCSVWAKGYFRKSVTLASLGRYEEAFITLTVCLYLVKATQMNDNVAILPIKNELIKVLHKIFSRPLYTNRRHSLESIHTKPYPSLRRKITKNTTGENYDYELNSEDNISKEFHKQTRLSNSSSILLLIERPTSQRRNRICQASTEKHFNRINRIFDSAFGEIKRMEKELLERTHPVPDSASNSVLRRIDKSLVSVNDFECTLCYRLLYEPVTTSCGHTYCRTCLERCLDHSSYCPLCKSSLVELMVHHKHSTTYFVEVAMKEYLPEEVKERSQQHDEEVESGIALGIRELSIPIFVCTIGFPTVPCPLHVFEPRYRLMIRRSMETGSKRFGMCSYSQDGEGNYADFGTLLEIRNVQYFADGRSVVDTVGIKRFKVIGRSMKDGYNTATVEIIHDRNTVDPNDQLKLKEIHDEVYSQAVSWMDSINGVLRQRIHTHFGRMPEPESNWMELPDGPPWAWWLLAILPLNLESQLAILRMNNLQKRLESILKVLNHIQTNNM